MASGSRPWQRDRRRRADRALAERRGIRAELGPDGGDASTSTPCSSSTVGRQRRRALEGHGRAGKVVIDATNDFDGINEYGPFDDGTSLFPSLAHQVKARTRRGEVVQPQLLGDIRQDRRADPRPATCSPRTTRPARSRAAVRDAGFDPIYGGTLGNARALEDFLAVAAANLSDGGYFFTGSGVPSSSEVSLHAAVRDDPSRPHAVHGLTSVRRLFATRVRPVGAGSAAVAGGRVARAAAGAECRAGLVPVDACRLHV